MRSALDYRAYRDKGWIIDGQIRPENIIPPKSQIKHGRPYLTWDFWGSDDDR